MREAKERVKVENTRRNFAGLGSPLYLACVERFDASTLADLERRAVEVQTERDEAAGARRREKEAKTAAAPPASPGPPAPRAMALSGGTGPTPIRRQDPSMAEIILRRPRANGSAR